MSGFQPFRKGRNGRLAGDAPMLSCSYSTITFNNTASDLLVTPSRRVELFFDKEAGKCAAKPSSDPEAYSLSLSGNNATVSCVRFLKATGLRRRGDAGNLRLPAQWNAAESRLEWAIPKEPA